MGESDKSFLRYSTSENGSRTIDLLDSIGWTADGQLRVVGVSMGSMIAQKFVKPPPPIWERMMKNSKHEVDMESLC